MNMRAELESCAIWTAKAAGVQNVKDFVESETYFEVCTIVTGQYVCPIVTQTLTFDTVLDF
jgi:hypothetical protein